MRIKQLKSDIIYLLKIIRLFNGRKNPVDIMVCKQYERQLEEIKMEIENFETDLMVEKDEYTRSN